jgi:hypothetical protein
MPAAIDIMFLTIPPMFIARGEVSLLALKEATFNIKACSAVRCAVRGAV